jgi:hypothetical protein
MRCCSVPYFRQENPLKDIIRAATMFRRRAYMNKGIDKMELTESASNMNDLVW